MKYQIGACAALVIGASAAHAGGIERTTQSAMLLFAEGNRVELSWGHVSPDVSGVHQITGAPIPANTVSGAVKSFNLPGFGLKYDLTDTVALALIYDRPSGADILYPLTDPYLGGTSAQADVEALTALAKAKVADRVSIFGGIRMQRASGQITYGGVATGPLNGYNVTLDQDTAYGYVLGAAYEIPDIALRLALTYNSRIEFGFDTTENGTPTGTTRVSTPESWNLEFQTGIAKDTLLTAGIRHVKHSQFRISPAGYDAVVNPASPGDSLISFDDATTYSLGIGRRFTPKLAASLTAAYEKTRGDLVSPLSPTDGRTSLTVGVSYKVTEQFEVSGGASYIWIGDADIGAGGTQVGSYRDNNATAVGLKVAYTF